LPDIFDLSLGEASGIFFYTIMGFLAWGLIGLFSGAFLAGTLVPFPSEALVIGAFEMELGFWPVLFIATAGNVTGGITNYWIGYKSNSKSLKNRFKLDDVKINKWQDRFGKWGYWLGLLSWIPFLGDPMIAVLGFFKVPFISLTIMMTIGKFGRYAILLWIYMQGMS